MAISDMKGTVSTTGIMNQSAKMPEGNVNPKLPQAKSTNQITKAPIQNTESSINNVINERVQTLTDEEMSEFSMKHSEWSKANKEVASTNDDEDMPF